MNELKKYIKKDGLAHGNYIKMDLAYSLGGMNYFTGGYNPRGYYFHISPVDVTPGKYGISESYILLSGDNANGFKIFLEETKRKSQKRMAELWEKIAVKANEIADQFADGNYQIVNAMVKGK